MQVFEKLRAVTAFEKEHLDFFSTVEDHHLIGEIGYHQAAGTPLTLKQLFLLDVGSIATVQRRLRRLKELGLVHHRRSASDRRAVELTLTPKCVRMFSKYEALLGPAGSSQQSGASGGPSHVCGLCDSDAGRRNLLVAYLAEGVKRGDKCILIAPDDVRTRVLAELNHRRKHPAALMVSAGATSVEAQFTLFKQAVQEARKADRPLRLAADMSWIYAKNVRFEAVLAIESRFDSLASLPSVMGMCVYDTRCFSGGEVLRAMKCHRDHARFPAVLG